MGWVDLKARVTQNGPPSLLSQSSIWLTTLLDSCSFLGILIYAVKPLNPNHFTLLPVPACSRLHPPMRSDFPLGLDSRFHLNQVTSLGRWPWHFSWSLLRDCPFDCLYFIIYRKVLRLVRDLPISLIYSNYYLLGWFIISYFLDSTL